MALFSSKKGYVGVDFGTSSIKMVELELDKGRPKLITYGYIEETTNIVKSDQDEDRAKTVASLKKLIKQSGVTTNKVIAALPPYAVFSSIISLPMMPNKDLISAVRWEAKKFVPMPLEEMILDWKVVKEVAKEDDKQTASQKPEDRVVTSDKKGKNLQILLTAAPKSLVKRYLDTFKQTEMQLISLETEAFALERSLVGEDKSAIMILDIGALGTHITVVADGIPVLNRSIDIGGATISKAIADSMNIDLSRAEQFKRDVGLATMGADNEQIPKTIEFVIGSIINEIKYCFNIYQNQEVKAIEKIILSGGSSFLNGLPEYLGKILNMKVLIGDPWSRIVYPVDLEPVLKEIGPKFAVAVGLAMRNLV
ncbi:MAG: pilus assembly protein PilM [Patescibacteria group bacterium]